MNETAEPVMNRVMGRLLAYRARIDSDPGLTLDEAARALAQEPENGLTEIDALDLLSQPPADARTRAEAQQRAETAQAKQDHDLRTSRRLNLALALLTGSAVWGAVWAILLVLGGQSLDMGWPASCAVLGLYGLMVTRRLQRLLAGSNGRERRFQ